ncbi:MAG TPA: M14 family zinc carboxypeptidase [Thermoanaerobaculia bacterium]|nr:M14 family zinc carboxypeptidase [Thermoanaerobaculia bacterium]
MNYRSCLLVASVLLIASIGAGLDSLPQRDPAQAIDEAYTKKIREYTTETFFLSPLVDYLPASKDVPTPAAVLGDIAGAPGKLPYNAEVSRYMRMLEKASARVRVRSIGTSEEGREMISVSIASESLIAGLDANRERLAKLADPRTIRLDDAEAERLVAASTPVYYITGTIHSPETGAPTALMELAYRLAVDESPYVKDIRDHVITVITPVVETDGRDRQVDIYNWHLAHPNQNWPPLIYWGKYVAHDNNRDAMALTLKLTRNVLNEFLFQKATLLHDLHESYPYLYDNTIGDGPFNAWLDPILTNEWQMLGWNNVQEMTAFGMPGVYAHGTFDTWTPGYLMFLAASHNGISRLYETFGNGGADTVERTLQPEQYSRTWWRQNPPLPRVKWSQRNNNNYEQTGLLVSLHYFAANGKEFLRNFYRKSKRSIEKPSAEGPAAYVFPADDPRPGAQAELLRILQLQGCEVSRATAPFTAMVDVLKKPPKSDDDDTAPAKPRERSKEREKEPESQTGPTSASAVRDNASAVDPAVREGASSPSSAGGERSSSKASRKPKWVREPRQFPSGSYVVRMDQPYSRVADMLLDYQYWSPEDPQKSPYDDTGWTLGELFHVQVRRVADPAVLKAKMSPVTRTVTAGGALAGSGGIVAIAHNGDSGLASLRFRFPKAEFHASEEAFEAGGRKFPRGSFLVRGIPPAELSRALGDLGVTALALSSSPDVRTHPLRAPRIAMLHTWLSTQDEGWWRMAFDELGIPYVSISTQTVAATPDLKSRYDVIVFPPSGRTPQAIVAGMPMWGNPLPWKKTPATPNLTTADQTDDIRPGLGFAGLQNLQAFARSGGLVIGVMDTAELAVAFGLTPGVAVTRPEKLKLTGTVVRSRVVDAASPIAYGYTEAPAIYSFDGPIFTLSNLAGGRGGRRRGSDEKERPTGRGTAEDPDRPTGRAFVEPPEEPEAETWEALPLTDEQKRNGIFVLPPEARPRVILRYGDSKDLLISGLLQGGKEIAEHPAVVDVPVERGHVVLFSNNPIWRGETRGSYALVWNAILNWDSLGVGRK